MFETEAGFAETKMLIKCNGDYSKKQDYKKGWKDGAEFGYNKATEELEARKFAIAMSEKVEKQLREQIEKMKCCENCKHYSASCCCNLPFDDCFELSAWELRK